MEDIQKTVFISYRRTNLPWALAIFQNLTQHGYDVFFDYRGTASGDFERVVLENIRARTHFLVLLTPSALEGWADPGDWMRREIETALQSHRNIVPLMLEGFDFSTPAIASQLTGTLAPLRRYNAIVIPSDYFSQAMERLRDRYLNVELDAALHPASSIARDAATEEKDAAQLAPAVAEEELTAQQWFERGFNAVDLDEKLRFYGNAIRLKPDYSEAFNGRGYARQLKGDLEGALRDYNEAIRLKPDYAMAIANRDTLLKSYGRRVQEPDLLTTIYNDSVSCWAGRSLLACGHWFRSGCAGGQRKVRTPQSGVPDNVRAAALKGPLTESATENIPPRSQESAGKGEKVR